MWDFSLLTAMQTVEKSMGFLLHRWLIFFGVATGFVLATLAGAGTAIGIGSLSSNPLLFGNFGAVTAFLAFGWICHRLRRTLYRWLRCPHLLLLASLSKKEGEIPEGWAQVEFARRAVAERVSESSPVWEIRRATAAVLGRLPDLFAAADRGAAPSWRRTVEARVRAWLAAANADLIIAGIVQGTAGRNPWQQARTGILMQANNLALLLKNRFALAVFEGVIFLLAYLLWLLAFQKIAAALPFPAGVWPHVFAFLFAWNIKASFLEPISDAAMMQLVLRPPEAGEAQSRAERLAAESESFRSIESAAGQ